MTTMPLQTTFAHRALTAAFLATAQSLGVTILAEDTEKNLKLVGFASDKLEAFFGRFCDISSVDGKTLSNVVSYGSSYDNKLIQQYRLTGYVSANGTLQADGVELAVTATIPTPAENGASKGSEVVDVYYPTLRGFANDVAHLPVYLYDSKGAKAPYYYSAIFRPQAKSFWGQEQSVDRETLISAIADLAKFADMPGFELRSPTNASVRLSSPDEVEVFRQAIEALPKDHANALRPQNQGLRRIDDLGIASYIPWTVVPNLKPSHYKHSEFWADLVWLLPDALKAPAWTREDIL